MAKVTIVIDADNINFMKYHTNNISETFRTIVSKVRNSETNFDSFMKESIQETLKSKYAIGNRKKRIFKKALIRNVVIVSLEDRQYVENTSKKYNISISRLGKVMINFYKKEM